MDDSLLKLRKIIDYVRTTLNSENLNEVIPVKENEKYARKLKEIAKRKGIGVSTLIRLWIRERKEIEP